MPRRIPVGLFVWRPSSPEQTQRPKDVGLALVLRGSARERFPAMQLPQGGYFGAAVIR
jgi:hypothetical protein